MLEANIGQVPVIEAPELVTQGMLGELYRELLQQQEQGQD
jgi:hypothetical protein